VRADQNPALTHEMNPAHHNPFTAASGGIFALPPLS
jgi:hypothetical protein